MKLFLIRNVGNLRFWLVHSLVNMPRNHAIHYSKVNEKPVPTFAVSASWGWVGMVLLLVGLFFGLCPRPVAISVEPVPIQADDRRWAQMIGSISGVISHYDGDVGLYIKDLKTGRTFEKDADKPFVSASLIKLPIMVAAFEAINEGRLSLSSRMALKRNFRRGGSGRLKWARSGSAYSVSSLIYEMITRSDNTATAMVIDRLGYDYLNQTFEKLGLMTTRINPSGMSLADRLLSDKDNYTTGNGVSPGTDLQS